MSKGWHLVARLGGTAAQYPHILVDARGWCLRLGPNHKNDEKYFSSLPALLHALVEHFVRRRLAGISTVLDLKNLASEVREALRSALALCSEACARGALEEHMKRVETRIPGAVTSGAGHPTSTAPSGVQDRSGAPERLKAV